MIGSGWVAGAHIDALNAIEGVEVDYYHGIGPWYGQYRWNTSKENGGSSLLSAGCHALDALLLCMGGEVEEVTSYATTSKNEAFAQYEYPTTTTTILKFTDGRFGKRPRNAPDLARGSIQNLRSSLRRRPLGGRRTPRESECVDAPASVAKSL
jgi:hypothetical protein